VSVQWTRFMVARDECVEAECAIGRNYGRRSRLGGRRFTARGTLGILNEPRNAALEYASQHSCVVER